MDVRTSTNEHVRAFALATVTEVGITIIPYHTNTNMGKALWRHGTASLFGRLLVYTRLRKTIIYSSRMRIDSAQLLKDGTAFPTEINSSPPIKHKHIRSLSHHLRAQSIKFGIGQVDVRTSTFEYLRLLR